MSSLASVRKAVTGSKPVQVAYGCAVAGRLGVERYALGWREPAPGPRHARILAYHSIGTPS